MTGKVQAVKADTPTVAAKQTNKPKKPAFKINEKELQGIAAATKLSPDFLSRIIGFEGFRNSNYHLAVNTIGVGHNIDEDPKFKADLKKGKPISISDKQVYSLFKKDMLKKKAEIKEILPNFDSLSQGQQEALVDLSFNLRPAALKNSKLLKAVSQNKFGEALGDFDFVKAEGKVLPGLCKRRIYDIELFASGMHPDKGKQAINDIIWDVCSEHSSDLISAGQQSMDNLEMSWVFRNRAKNPIVAQNR